LCIWYGLYATPKHHNHNLACGLIFGDLLRHGKTQTDSR